MYTYMYIKDGQFNNSRVDQYVMPYDVYFQI